MVYIGADTLHGETGVSESGEKTFSVPGLVAATIWALGLLVGMAALATRHELLAGVTLVLAIVSPWFGLAWVSHSQRREVHAHRNSGGSAASYAGGWPAR